MDFKLNFNKEEALDILSMLYNLYEYNDPEATKILKNNYLEIDITFYLFNNKHKATVFVELLDAARILHELGEIGLEEYVQQKLLSLMNNNVTIDYLNTKCVCVVNAKWE